MKLQVLVSEDLASRIDRLSDYIGSSRSSVCAAIIAKSISEWEEIYFSSVEESTNTQSEYEQLKIQE